MTEWNFADIFEVVADTVPDTTAMVTEDRRLTYAEVDERANRLAHVLAAADPDKYRITEIKILRWHNYIGRWRY